MAVSPNQITQEPVPRPPQENAAGQAGQHIAELLLKAGHISAEQLRYARRVCSKLPSPRTLVSVLQDLHLITPEKLRSTLASNALAVPLGELLLELGYISEPDLKTALALQSDRPECKLGEILTESRFVSEDTLIEALSFQMGYEHVSMENFTPDPEFFRAAPLTWFQVHSCVPLARRNGAVVVAFADPTDRNQIETVTRLLGCPIIPGIARKDEIIQALKRAASHDTKPIALRSNENIVVQTVDEIITAAAESGASDIHIEPGKNFLRIRFRKDGVLIKHKELPIEMAGPLTSRIKILASVDIAEKRRHQDGRILFDYQDNPLDIRMATYGTIYGETIVMRLLNNRAQMIEIREIGMPPRVVERYIVDALDSPTGVIIVTGPTGSGKTTTLYASIQYLNKIERSIITAEDPVEYVIDGISQCSINPKINVTFEDTLKHIVRQDPDVIVIGEIRDQFSAETAIQAALTGHKVLTTFHTEDSIGGLLRLLNMNIEAFLISSAVISVVAQRLVRRICPHCVADHHLTHQQIRHLGYEPREMPGLLFKIGRGCPQCRFRGYNGRVAVFELLVLNEIVKDAIIAHKTSYEIRRLSVESTGLVTLLEDAIHKASKGLTSYEEIIRQIPRLSKPRPLQLIEQLLGEN
jgi:type IV pilus assembly protein PilB